MQETPNLSLPYIMPAQAQKHVTHNEALRALDAVVQLSVRDRNLTVPPASPMESDRYIVAAGASGAWEGQDNQIAARQDEAWAFYTPREGWLAFVADEGALVAYDGTAWEPTASLNPTPLVGVNATADATNRFAVASPATLFNHEGAGHQIKINKNMATDTASVVFQSGFSGRAEMGLVGDDGYLLKVSADGADWRNAIAIDRNTGRVSLPNSPNPGFETAYGADSLSVPHAVHTVVSNVTLGLDELGDSSYASGVWTVGASDTGLWLLTAFAQFNASTRALLTFEVKRSGASVWDVVSRVQDEGAGEISRTVALSPLLFLNQGDEFRFSVLHSNTIAVSRTLRFFTANARRIQ